MFPPLCCTRDRVLKFQLSNDQKPQEPKVWTPLVLRVWNFRHDTTLSCLVFSVKTIEKITPLENLCSWSRSNIFTTSFISAVHNSWYWWLKNPKKSCLTRTPSFDFAETGCWAPIWPDVTSTFVGWFWYKKSARLYGVFPPAPGWFRYKKSARRYGVFPPAPGLGLMYRRELYLCKLRYVKDILNRARDLNRTSLIKEEQSEK